MDTTEEILRPIKPINCGQDGSVWLVKDMAVKVHHAGPRETEKELEVALDLFNEKVSIPTPRGLFRINIFGEEKTGFGMDYIANSKNAYGSKEAEDLMQTEIEKARKVGYNPVDIMYKHNCLWIPEDKKIYLIDFVGWKKVK
jgi:hypothetical protein